ncbi:MogA/MoaB family molybdenum cofactor biosynthesis protein [Anaerococcus sp. AGMB00486]|uniref:MogA/MoaB family molybdenum cofactor biosynthesis protein n=2 Tax=Anaerococcus TaxID=165779 RepID=A0ABX2NAF2_9FIRM|nr:MULTISPECIES: MogA/MoaB family molybdenum cofactor biosynthesis protein [Anaerococcus]MSS77765.1 MogA/MoaB family molybdenum cofactor biosynthesis protein [Anaerococcus porci]NVF11620.1 MogA/MoaB family molybdenum cofactor biosynthesis protein [Anaerococcus faecalis]
MTTKEKVYKYAFIVLSDSRSGGEKKDKCKDALLDSMDKDYKMEYFNIIPDDKEKILDELKKLVDKNIPLILTSGGTGFSKRDNTPEATKELIEKNTPGISEAIRFYSKEITPMWALSRAVSGIAKNSLIINLPGSPKAVSEAIDAIRPFLGHGLDILKGDFTDHD